MGRRTVVAAGMVAALVVAGAVVADRTADPVASHGVQATQAGHGEAATAGAQDAAAGGASTKLADPQIAPLPPGGGTIDPGSPKIVRTADVSIQVGKGRFGNAFDRVAAIASANGGYVTASTTSTSSRSTSGDRERADSGQLTVRVPAGRFDEARTSLRQLGTVEQEGLRGEDVSGQLVDYDARLRSLQAQEESLRALLGKAANVGEVLQVQTALFDVRQQIEQLQGRRAQLDQAATLATIQVSLYEPGAQLVEPDPEPATSLASAFDRARDGALAVIGGMIVVLGWLTPLAVIGLIAWGALRLRRRPAPAAAAPTS